MKTKFFLLFLFMMGTVTAQKEITPYTYSTEDDNTIIIYASPSSVNNVTFTLKNAKDETLKDDQENELKFTVFPFEEVRFRAKFNEQIEKVKNTIIRQAFSYEPKDRQKNVREIRTMFQFFKSLIESAYEYDTEPIAGTLSYEMNPKISKKIVDDFNTDEFFYEKAEKVLDYIHKQIKNDSEISNTEAPITTTNLVASNITESTVDLSWNVSSDMVDASKYDVYQEATKIATVSRITYQVTDLTQSTSYNFSIIPKDDAGKKSAASNIVNATTLAHVTEASNTKDILRFFKDDTFLKELDAVTLERYLTHYKYKDYNKLIWINFNKKQEFKNYLKEQLAIEYNHYKVKKLIKNPSFTTYFNTDKNLRELESIKLDLEKKIVNKEIKQKEKAKNDTTATNLKADIEKLKTKLKEYNNDRDIEYDKLHNAIINLRNNIINFPLWELEVSKDNGIQIEFNDGFLEHIEVVGYIKQPYVDFSTINYDNLEKIESFKLRNESFSKIEETLQNLFEEEKVKEFLRNQEKEIKFENYFPFGFSSKADYADLYTYEIHSYRGREKSYTLKMNDVLTLYKQKHQIDRLDFSPKNITIQLPEKDIDKNGKIELKKEKSSKILSAKIYSDFLGFKEKNPNGLIQAEVDKFIPLWTKRRPVREKTPLYGRGTNYGFLNYANFNLTWSKIGDEDRDLQVKYRDQYINNEYKPSKYITYLDIVERENISVGVDLNILTFDIPISKVRFEINYGLHYGRIKVIDSLKNGNEPLTNFFNKDVNTIRHYPDVIVRIRPEERFGGYIRFRPFRIIVPNEDEFFSVSSAKDFVGNEKLTKGWLNRYELSAHYTPSIESDNKFFFRYKYTNAANFEENGYSEFQVGYLMYLKF